MPSSSTTSAAAGKESRSRTHSPSAAVDDQIGRGRPDININPAAANNTNTRAAETILSIRQPAAAATMHAAEARTSVTTAAAISRLRVSGRIFYTALLTWPAKLAPYPTPVFGRGDDGKGDEYGHGESGYQHLDGQAGNGLWMR